jgi:hypothetical protein
MPMRRLDIRERRAEIAKLRAAVDKRGHIELQEVLHLIGHIVADIGVRGSEEGALEEAGRCLDGVREGPRLRAVLEELSCIAEAALKLRGRMRPE